MPCGVVTVTSTVPVPAGEMAVIWVAGIDREAGGIGGAEHDRRRPGEVGSGDDDAGAAGRGAAGGAQSAHDRARRDHKVDVLVSPRDRGAPGSSRQAAVGKLESTVGGSTPVGSCKGGLCGVTSWMK